jgi:hypothetical protein
MKMKQSAVSVIALAGLGLLAGCGRAPSFNILGSFFPAWLICMIVGIILAALAHWILKAINREKLIHWGIIVYPCLAAFFAFTLWLIFFS